MDIDMPSSPPVGIKADYDARGAALESGDSEYLDAESRSSSASPGRDDILITKPDYSRPRDNTSPAKRLAEPHEDEQLVKRSKLAFNHHYTSLLNADIEDTANQLVLEIKRDGTWKLWPSQIGLTLWTPLEKELFFEAVSRLGRDDLPGISARVRTKNEVEVRQYLKLFEDVFTERSGNPQRTRWEDVLEMSDHPAAKEISPACCDALEQAADDLSKRVDRYEQKLEKRKWGDEHWCVDATLAKRLYDNNQLAREQGLHFSLLFRLPMWLRLSEHVFMNSSDPEGTWTSVADEEPSIRSTALEDFHTLVVSLTKKLVASALYVAQSRIKAKRAIKPDTKSIVKRRDVQGAAASLGLTPTLHQQWATCARRLRLNVYEDTPPTEEEASDDEQERPLSYDAVEGLLLPKDASGEALAETLPTRSRIMSLVDFELSDPDSSAFGPGSDTTESDADVASDTGSAGEQDMGKPGTGVADGGGTSSKAKTQEDIDIRDEAKEILVYSAHEFPETLRTREALEMRIRREREQERYAEYIDSKASLEEEADLWRILQQCPPAQLAKPEFVEKPSKSITGLDEMHDHGSRWRNSLVYVNEWETPGRADP